MKKQKMKLDSLKVESFTTGINDEETQATLMGGKKYQVVKTINDAYCHDTGPAKCFAISGNLHFCNDNC